MIFSLLYNFFTRSLIVLLVAMLSVNYLPDKLFNDFPFEPKSMEPTNFEAVIPQWNTKLTDSQPEYIQLNNILGPESVAVAPNTGRVYTGLADGRIVELNPSKSYQLRQVLRFKESPSCKDNIATQATECGRFLQMRFQNNTLYALEANTGLYKVDVAAGSKAFVGPKSINKINLYNGFAFDPKRPNMVYMTISSTRRDLLSIVWSLMEADTSGQLVALDISTGKRVVLMDNLPMPNGVEVDANRDRLIFSETLLSRVNSLALKEARAAFDSAKDGAKLKSLTGTMLIPIVPGFPDNIIVEGDIAYIALPFVRTNGKELVDQLSSMANVRKAYGRLVFGVGKLLEYICENLYHHPLLEATYQELKSGHFNYRIVQSNKSAVIEYNLASGTSRLLGTDSFSFLSEATPLDNKGNLMLGSFRSPFLVKVKI